MDKQLKHIRNITGSEADIFLYGDIGFDVNAKQFVDELRWVVDYVGVKTVNVRINSNGGLVTDGLGIFGAIMAFREKGITVNTWNDGIAASIAGVILMSGEKIYMISHGLIMVHKAWVSGQIDEKMSNALNAMNESISRIFSERSGLEKPEIDDMLEKETWITSDRAKELNLIDEVYKQPAAVNMASVQEIYNSYKKSSMKQVVQYLNLSEAATEAEVIAAIKAQSVDPKVAELEKENAEMKKKVEALEAEKLQREAAETEVQAEAVVSEAINKGLFEESERPTLIEKAKNGLEDFKFLVEKMKVPHASISDKLKTEGEDRSKWGFREWTQNDPKGFEALENSNPELFKKILNSTRNK